MENVVQTLDSLIQEYVIFFNTSFPSMYLKHYNDEQLKELLRKALKEKKQITYRVIKGVVV
jgi:predicted RNA-binding protein